MPEDVIISSDIGNNCAIGNAYPTFEKPRKYLAPGLFGPCGYGFPSILGAKIGCPDTPVIGFAGDGAFGISGDAKLVASQILEKLSSNAGDTDRQKRKDLIHQTKSAWLQKLSSLDHEDDDEGTVWNKEARERDADRMSPRQAWRAIQALSLIHI